MPERFAYFRPKRPRKPKPCFSKAYGPHWGALRLKILARDNWQCQMCHRVVGGEPGEAQVDHRLRKGLGGSDDESNLWVLCIKCHGRKSREEQNGLWGPPASPVRPDCLGGLTG